MKRKISLNIKFIYSGIILLMFFSCNLLKHGEISTKGDLYYTDIMPAEVGIPDKRVFVKFYKSGEVHEVVSNKPIKDVFSTIDYDYTVKTTYKEINGCYKYNYTLEETIGVGLNGETEQRKFWYYCYTLNKVSDTITIETQSQWVKEKKKGPHIFRLDYYKYYPEVE